MRHAAWRILEFAKHNQLSILFLAVIVICTFLSSGQVISQAVNPQDGNINVEGTVPAMAPSQPAVITKPTKNQNFNKSPITVSGTCSGETIVEIYKNNVFAGSAACKTNGTFSLTVDLFVGANTLVAKIKDSLGQYGPDSAPVKVTYKPLVSPPRGATGGSSGEGPALSPDTQLLLLIDADYRGIFPGDRLTIEPSILGGVAPYAIKIDWGDGSEEIIARNKNGQFRVSHIYDSSGTMTIKIYASDNANQKAFVQTVAIVNGQVEEDKQVTTGTKTTMSQNWWWVVIIIIVLLIGLLIGILLGRRRRKHHPNDETNLQITN